MKPYLISYGYCTVPEPVWGTDEAQAIAYAVQKYGLKGVVTAQELTEKEYAAMQRAAAQSA